MFTGIVEQLGLMKKIQNKSGIRKLGIELDLSDKKKEQPRKPRKERKEKEVPFKPERFPSFLNLMKKNDGETPVSIIPLGGERTLKFQTDVENAYFDRSEETGDLQVGLLNSKPNETKGGTAPGEPKQIEDLLNVNTESPQNGIIKISFNPKENVQVGDEMQVKVNLNGAGQDFEEILLN